MSHARSSAVGFRPLVHAMVLLAGLGATVSTQAPQALAAPDGEVHLGDVIPFGNGTARSWVEVDGAGHPVSVGITLTEAALEGLAADVTPGMIWTVEYILHFPRDIEGLPFDHVGVNWNPKGHPPPGIYSPPHFDFHFYTVSTDMRSRITARGPDLERCRATPAAGHLPASYVYAPESEEPGMGGHWIDPGSHEFHGQPFTSTFIFGTYDSEVIFWEPMITKAYLESRPSMSTPIPAPDAYARPGYYPTSYKVHYDTPRKEYVVALDGMTLR